MARNLYGCTSADFTLTTGGRVIAGATATVWTARTGGTQITDLTDLDGDPITSVTSDTDGGVRFYGVDGSKATLWLDTGLSERIAVRPVDLTGETGPTPNIAVGTVDTGTAAVTVTGTAEDPVLNFTLPPVGEDAGPVIGSILLAQARAMAVFDGGTAYQGPDPLWDTIFGGPFADCGAPSAGTPTDTFDGGSA